MSKNNLIIAGYGLAIILFGLTVILLIPKKYTVTFDTDGGTTMEQIEVKKGTTIGDLEVPKKEGYSFVSWTLDEKTYDLNTKITKNITLKATWKKVEEQDEEKPAETYLNNIKNSSNATIMSGWEQLIINYLDLYYKSLMELNTQEVTNLFTNPSGTEAHYAYSAIDLLIYHHKIQPNDMKLTKVKYDIEYTKVSTKDNVVTINFLVDDYMNFKYLGDIESKEIDVKYEMRIRKENNVYTIDSIRVVQGNFVMFTNELDIKNTTIEKINTLKQKYKKAIDEDLKENNELMVLANQEKYTSNVECDHGYDRIKATEYAYKYANSRNKAFLSYDNSGGNCQNYVSQCIYAGGVPMDTKGTNQWRHYTKDANSNNQIPGKTGSWTAVRNFYRYVVNEKGSGLCTDIDRNIFYAEPGDVAHVGYDGFSHAVIVVKEIYDVNNNKIDFLVNSNTASLENYPFMAYIYPNKRVIKVLGYNE